jgi:C1A family cysteine protease
MEAESFIGTNNRSSYKKVALAFLAVLGVVGVVAVVALYGGAAPVQAYSDLEHLEFKAWMAKHGKNHEGDEYFYRLGVYHSNKAQINEWNNSDRTYRVGINKFADLPNEEFRQIYTRKMVLDRPRNIKLFDESLEVPKSVDWRTKGAVGSVLNQGQCGSCWSFSTAESVASAYFLSTGKMVQLSEQQLMDCSTSYGNHGCNGGLMDNAFKYVMKYGLESSADYPYQAADGTCHYDASKVVTKISGYHDVPARSTAQLQAAVAQQPVSIAVDAGGFGW